MHLVQIHRGIHTCSNRHRYIRIYIYNFCYIKTNGWTVCSQGCAEQPHYPIPSSGRWSGEERQPGPGVHATLNATRQRWRGLCTIRALLHKQTGETADFMMLERETRLLKHLMYEPAAGKTTSREGYAGLTYGNGIRQSKNATVAAYDGGQARRAVIQSWATGLAKTERFSEGQSHKLRQKI